MLKCSGKVRVLQNYSQGNRNKDCRVHVQLIWRVIHGLPKHSPTGFFQHGDIQAQLQKMSTPNNKIAAPQSLQLSLSGKSSLFLKLWELHQPWPVVASFAAHTQIWLVVVPQNKHKGALQSREA